jgi:hypothetical protein
MVLLFILLMSLGFVPAVLVIDKDFVQTVNRGRATTLKDPIWILALALKRCFPLIAHSANEH